MNIKKYILTVMTFVLFLGVLIPFNSASANEKNYGGKDIGVSVDIARGHQDLTTLKHIVKKIHENNGTYLQLHFSDNEAYAIDSSVLKIKRKNNNGEGLSDKELNELIQYANKHDIMVIPELDLPSHTEAILKRIYEMDKKKYKLVAWNDYTINFTDTRTIKEISQPLLEEVMVKFYQPKYKGSQKIVIGGDEVPGGLTYQGDFIYYMNSLAKTVTNFGYTPQMWNDSITSNGLSHLNKNVEILYWISKREIASIEEFTDKGYNVYNYDFYSNYYLPSKDYNSTRKVKENSDYIERTISYNTFIWGLDTPKQVDTNKIKGNGLAFWLEHSEGLSQKDLRNQQGQIIDAFYKGQLKYFK